MATLIALCQARGKVCFLYVLIFDEFIKKGCKSHPARFPLTLCALKIYTPVRIENCLLPYC
jgi:hypothetical protein